MRYKRIVPPFVNFLSLTLFLCVKIGNYERAYQRLRYGEAEARIWSVCHFEANLRGTQTPIVNDSLKSTLINQLKINESILEISHILMFHFQGLFKISEGLI